MSTTLNSGSLLQSGRYRIERVLGQGGFGITYLATHTGFDQKVALKEFYMKELCVRNEETSFVTLGTGESSATVERFRGKFLKEARNLFRLNHKHIVRVLDIFEENGTAYFAMEYAEGGSLSQKVKAEGALPEAVATRYILQVAEALAYLHERKMNHLDVKPANIMLSASDDAVLIDFGLAKQYDATGGQTSTTPAGISEGYAPMEQYKLGGVAEFTPETDIYALGATFFKLLTGVTPPSAQDVFEDGVPVDTLRQHNVSEAAISVIEQAMEPSKKKRMSSAKVFTEGLSAVASTIEATVETVEETVAVSTPKVAEATKIAESVKVEAVAAPASSTPKHVAPRSTAASSGADAVPASALEAELPSACKPQSQSAKTTKSKMWWIVGTVASVVITASIFFMQNSNEGDAEIPPVESVMVSGTIGGHDYVDLGLPSGTLWATCNLGASKPEEYGDYFAWGETQPKDSYDWNTYFDTSDGGKTFSKYNFDGGKTVLDLEDDAAYKNWGKGWRMPSQAQIAELKDNCNWEWTSVNGVEGYVVQSKKNNSSLFLPAAGYRGGGSLYDAGSYGFYWSRSLYTSSSYDACYLLFGSSGIYWFNFGRFFGLSVRPVRVSGSE